MEKNKKSTVKVLRKNVYSSPQKAMLVANNIKNKTVSQAIGILDVLNKKVAHDFKKCINTAVNNYNQKYKINDTTKLYIKEVNVNEGRKTKGYVLGARGRIGYKFRRYCHIYITLQEK